jgi:catechol 2,3-dioxygenase-like lactoylglutathione lyase family enzyme
MSQPDEHDGREKMRKDGSDIMEPTFSRLMQRHETGRISRRHLLLSLPALMMPRRTFAQAINPPIRVRGINHVTLSVSDVKRSVDFYQGLFGMPVESRQGMTTNLQVGAGPQFLGVSAAGSNPPNISHLCLGVDNFDVDRITSILVQRGITKSDAAGNAGAGGLAEGPMRMRVRMRGPEAGGDTSGTPELYFSDPDGLVVQLQDPRYCGGGGTLGNIYSSPEPAPKKGLLAVRDWNHCTCAVSDAARSNAFYQELFGLRIQAHQGPTAPLLGVGGVQFLMFAGGGGDAANTASRPRRINHLCMSMEAFKPDAVIRALEGWGIQPRGSAQESPRPLVYYINMRMENRGGAKAGTPELYFTDPDGLLIQLQDVTYCGGGGVLGNVCS